MPRNRKNQGSARRVVAVAFPSIAETELAVLDGIREEIGHEQNWEVVVISEGYEGMLRQLAGALAGAIGDFVSETWLQALRAQGVALVQLAHCSAVEGVCNVAPDYGAMGRAAAQALRANGVTAFAFAGAPGQYASGQLFAGFADGIAGDGAEVRRSSGVSLARIREFLRHLPRPLGLFAASDRLARFAVLAARELGWSVPGEIAVIGLGDVRLESLYAGIPLSSFELPGRELGRMAARALLQQIAGRDAAELSALRPTGILHERQSSLRSPTGIERALSYARSNLGQPLQVPDLCRVAGMSRRSLENAMQSLLGTTPAGYLQALRRERAETLLRTTQMSVQAIARACGYAEPSVFATAFRRWSGEPPSAYRLRQAG